MNSILVPILAVTVIGLICGLLLAVASVVMEVKVDERITAVRECLPGANCGSCVISQTYGGLRISHFTRKISFVIMQVQTKAKGVFELCITALSR